MDDEYYEIQKEFNEICFSLNKLESRLTKLTIENFVLNPEIGELTQQIKDLRNEKEKLKKFLTTEEAKNGK